MRLQARFQSVLLDPSMQDRFEPGEMSEVPALENYQFQMERSVLNLRGIDSLLYAQYRHHHQGELKANQTIHQNAAHQQLGELQELQFECLVHLIPML